MNIDEPLCAGDEHLVDRIARVQFGEKKHRLYSFATKYCAWHQPALYQIYDSLAHEVLCRYGKAFMSTPFKGNDLKDYPSFVRIVAAFKAEFGLTSLSRKKMDEFLWMEGRRLAGEWGA